MHLICDLPKDKIIWDVGHQSYTHKLLTGRKEGFEDLRSYGGMSGFPKRKESDCDALIPDIVLRLSQQAWDTFTQEILRARTTV